MWDKQRIDSYGQTYKSLPTDFERCLSGVTAMPSGGLSPNTTQNRPFSVHSVVVKVQEVTNMYKLAVFLFVLLTAIEVMDCGRCRVLHEQLPQVRPEEPPTVTPAESAAERPYVQPQSDCAYNSDIFGILLLSDNIFDGIPTTPKYFEGSCLKNLFLLQKSSGQIRTVLIIVIKHYLHSPSTPENFEFHR
ncbi:hypothetical protein J6590_089418 [Homalodisca vitripennis]|nr:hypothetical protein J6590_089418 [Homalodisca vitripennis]